MEAYQSEFLGTALLVLLGGGVCANVALEKSYGHASGWIVVATGWALAVFVSVWCFGAVSAHINPAVSVGLAMAGKFPWADVPLFIAAQIAGGFLGGVLVWVYYRDQFAATKDPGTKLGVFSTGPAIANPTSNFISELIGTFVLVFALLMAVEPTVEFTSPLSGESEAALPAKLGLGALGALPTGLLVLAIGVSLGGTTGYAINPARDLGPRLAHAVLPIPGKGHSNWGYAWIPVVAPLAGAVLAALAVRMLT
jgi:glycerol uptake facilitator protein